MTFKFKDRLLYEILKTFNQFCYFLLTKKNVYNQKTYYFV